MRFQNISLIFSLLFFLPILFTGDEENFGKKMIGSLGYLKQHVQNIHFDRSPFDNYPMLEQAAGYIRKEFLNAGMEVSEDPFQWQGRVYRNIVAEKRGVKAPDKIFIIGAHYDTVPGSPGADDNASAIAVLIEVAKNIQTTPLAKTLRLIAFSLEEYDCVGSTHYVEKVREREENILGMISLEMVGFTGPKQNYPHTLNPKYYPHLGDFIGIIGNERSKAIMEGVRRSFKTHIPQLPTEFLMVPRNGEGMEEARLSDHAPFWDHRLPALMITDTGFLRNPNYHLPSDTMETLDFEFMRKVAIGISHSIVELTK